MKRRRVGFSPEASAQLVALYRYIADEATPEIARRYTDAIIEHCEKLDHFPARGMPRDGIRSGLRTLSFRRRVIIAYGFDTDNVTVIGIYYGGQDFEAMLHDKE